MTNENTRDLQRRFPRLSLSFKTIHSSKGLEADHVVLLRADAGQTGFPSEIVDDVLLALVSPEAELFENAEERRLMYVAMTRARHTLTVMASNARPSAFVTELKTDPAYAITTEKTEAEAAHVCGECGGRLLGVIGQDGRTWYRCEHIQHCGNRAATQTLTSQEARRELGVSQGVIVKLLESGLLPRVEERTSIRGYSRIRVQDLREFQRRIFKSVVVGETSGDMLTTAKVCRATLLETPDVLSALIDGSLEKVSAPFDHEYRIDRLLFNREEVVRHFLNPRRTLGGMDGSKILKQRDAATYLKVKTATVPYLMTVGLLESQVVANPVIRRKQSGISVTALDAFMEKFIPVSEVAAQYETHTNVALEALRKQGIGPIYDDCGTQVSRFVRRSELAEVSLDIPKRPKRNRRRSARPA
ncbi:3'-5' exonuclease [Rhizobium leguminosarum]|uniref:helix-turn-helix domain-containing protein n=1 Tax=Rhizobium leguminosarum TaxID=384 RepID=UPI003F968780